MTGEHVFVDSKTKAVRHINRYRISWNKGGGQGAKEKEQGEEEESRKGAHAFIRSQPYVTMYANSFQSSLPSIPSTPPPNDPVRTQGKEQPLSHYRSGTPMVSSCPLRLDLLVCCFHHTP